MAQFIHVAAVFLWLCNQQKVKLPLFVSIPDSFNCSKTQKPHRVLLKSVSAHEFLGACSHMHIPLAWSKSCFQHQAEKPSFSLFLHPEAQWDCCSMNSWIVPGATNPFWSLTMLGFVRWDHVPIRLLTSLTQIPQWPHRSRAPWNCCKIFCGIFGQGMSSPYRCYSVPHNPAGVSILGKEFKFHPWSF